MGNHAQQFGSFLLFPRQHASLENRAERIQAIAFRAIATPLKVDRIRNLKSLVLPVDNTGNCGDSAILQGCGF